MCLIPHCFDYKFAENCVAAVLVGSESVFVPRLDVFATYDAGEQCAYSIHFDFVRPEVDGYWKIVKDLSVSMNHRH